MTIQEEESAAQANTTGSAVAGKDNPMKLMKRSRFMNTNVFEVEHDVYCNCVNGKKLGARWDKYVEDEEVRNVLKKEFQKGKSVLVQSALTKSMVYLRK